MRVFYEKHYPDELPPDELSAREKALLQSQQDQERIQRWRHVAGPKPKTIKAILVEKKWVWLTIAILLMATIGWKAGWFSPNTTNERPVFASRSDLLDYPFDNITVRGAQDAHPFARASQALEAYRKKDFEAAQRGADPSDHFFIGVCWLQQKNAQKALDEFEQVSPKDKGLGDEFFYYKGVALQDLGRREEANQAFQQVLDSRTARELFRAEASKRMKK